MKMTDLNEKYGDDDFGLKGHGSELDFDMRASDKDKSSADDNIIMQVRKAHQMRFGQNKPIKFRDGSEHEINQNVLIKLDQHHTKLRTSDQKDEFANAIAQSKEDMAKEYHKIKGN
jgi:hypothetical protein|tara:strand:+ start:580 stop:927 length:348 start_codon:yes stop_codon:yes gene_type:complete